MEKQNVTQKTSQSRLGSAEEGINKWYQEEFLPYKKIREAEKNDFNEFAEIIIKHTQEVKYMLANIYDNNSEKAVETWNSLNLEPKIKDIKLIEDNLVIVDENSQELLMKFDDLLNNINKVIGS